MKKIWHDQAWEDYLNLQNDKKLLKKAKKNPILLLHKIGFMVVNKIEIY